MQRRRMQCAGRYDPSGGATRDNGRHSCKLLSHQMLNNPVSSPASPSVAWRLPDFSPALTHGSRRALVLDPASPALHRPRAFVSAPVFLFERGGS